jgi:thiol:disulfide interchange protein DsbA
LKIGSGKKKMKYGLAMMAVGFSIMAIFGHTQAPSLQSAATSYQSIPRIEAGADVIEFFWYGCPHCKSLEQELRSQRFHNQINELVRADGTTASFRRVPATLNPLWTLHARLYFALDNLGMSDEGHFNTMKSIGASMPKTLDEIRGLLDREILVHETQSNRSFSASAQQVADLMFSTQVDNQIAEAERLAKAANISGVPVFVVDSTHVVPLGQGLDYKSIGPAVLSLLSPRDQDTSQ